MTARLFHMAVFIGLCGVFLSSCATMGGWFGRGEAQTPSDLPEYIEVGENADRMLQLQSLVKKHVDIVARRRQTDETKLIHRSPYYYKEYAIYGDDWDQTVPDIRETGSRTTPYAASVDLPKLRYSTKMSRDRLAAQADTNFRRDTGVETLTYELRNGRWVRVGSLYLAEKSEENVNGEWVPVRIAPPEDTALQADDRGFFRRVWSGIAGN